MSTNFNTCFIDSNGADVSQEFIEKSYLLDVYPNLIDPIKAPSLWMWGFNKIGVLGNCDTGVLGDNTVTSKSSPVQTVSTGVNWKQVDAGYGVASAIKSDGTLWIWGCNSAGELGTNNLIHRSSPVQTVSGGTNWKQVSVGVNHVAAVKTDGTLWLWGDSAEGALGNSALGNPDTSSPVQTISAGTNWKQVAAGYRFTAAIKTDGTLWMWGSNGIGQLGRNSLTNTSSPVQTVSGGTNWKEVSVTCQATAAIKTDGTLWFWGFNYRGTFGNNNQIDQSSPVQTVSGGTNWKQVSVGENNSAAIKTDGTLWLSGSGSSGSLGDDTTTNRSSPVQTVSGGTNWKQISVGSTFSAAIKTDGTLWLWGDGTGGNLGTNTGGTRSSPVQTISGGNNWKQVATGRLVTGAIREEGDW